MSIIVLPTYDRQYRLSTYDGRDMSELRDEAERATESQALLINRSLWTGRVEPLDVPSSPWRKVVYAAIPRVSWTFFNASCIAAVALVFSAQTASEWIEWLLRGWSLEAPFPVWRGRIWLGMLMDPLVMHALLAAAIVGVWVTIVHQEKGKFEVRRLVVLLVAVFGTLVASFLVVDQVWKPVLDLPRPSGYRHESETPVVRVVSRFISKREGVPSGFSVRQVLLFLTLIWALRHPTARSWPLGVRGLLVFAAGVSVAVVGVQRYWSDAHAIGDVLLGGGVAVAAFWTIVLCASAAANDSGRRSEEGEMVADVARVWLILGLALAFYTENSVQAILLAALVSSVLMGVRFAVLRGFIGRGGEMASTTLRRVPLRVVNGRQSRLAG